MTATITQIDYAKAVELLDDAIFERGEDYVYRNPTADTAVERNFPQCAYAHKNEATGVVTPGCGVGDIWIRCGVDAAPLVRLQGTAYSAADSPAVASVITHTQKALYFLNIFQSEQDNGATWGSARQTALRYTHDRYRPQLDSFEGSPEDRGRMVEGEVW